MTQNKNVFKYAKITFKIQIGTTEKYFQNIIKFFLSKFNTDYFDFPLFFFFFCSISVFLNM